MKEIIRVKTAGFCFGVKRAVKLAEDTGDKFKGKKIYTFGELIHNRDVVNDLENKGIKITENSNVKNSVVILRSHGIEKNILENLEKNKNIIIDATCPYVKKIHKSVEKLNDEGYFIVIIGDKEHPEVKAIASYSKEDNFKIISSEKEIDINFFKKKGKIGIVAQTTQSLENFLNICKKIITLKKEFKIYNTICDSTSIRQKETIEVAKKVDCMIVVGGKNSANTKRLYEISKELLSNVYHIENKDELDLNLLKNFNKIGVTAGASTPEEIIEGVIQKIRGLK